jgi:hypothetical protein
MSIPLSIPTLLILKSFHVSTPKSYVTLGMVTGLLNYWIFHECKVVYEQYQNVTMSFFQVLHEILQISAPGVPLMEMSTWGLTGFIFWLIVIRRWPAFSRPSPQEKQV